MNFVDPKEYNYPGLVRKNRYKTILPSEYNTDRHCTVVYIYISFDSLYIYRALKFKFSTHENNFTYRGILLEKFSHFFGHRSKSIKLPFMAP